MKAKYLLIGGDGESEVTITNCSSKKVVEEELKKNKGKMFSLYQFRKVVTWIGNKE